MKAVSPPGYHHNGLVASHVLGHIMRTIHCAHPMPDMGGQWRSLPIVSITTNRVFNKS